MSGVFFFFQAEDGIRDAQESRGLGDVYKRQGMKGLPPLAEIIQLQRDLAIHAYTGGHLHVATLSLSLIHI